MRIRFNYPCLFVMLLFVTNISFAQLPVYFDDQFDRNTNQWPEKIEKYSVSLFKKGVYSMQHKSDFEFWAFQRTLFVDPRNDFRIETSMSQVEGAKTNGFGLLWGAQGRKDYHVFLVNSEGNFMVRQQKKGTAETENKWIASAAVKGFMQPNVLVVERKADSLFFFVNGVKVVSKEFPGIFGNKIGFVVFGKSTIEADYLTVKAPEPQIDLIENAKAGYKKVSLGEAINSAYIEINPVISPDGKMLFVTRMNHPENTGIDKLEDIWMAVKDKDGKWGKLENVGAPLNTANNNSVISVTPDGNTLLLSNTYNDDGTSKGAGISISEKTLKGWSVPKEQHIEDYYNYNKFKNFCLSADRKIMLMAVERQGFGNLDLHVSFLVGDNKWSKPLNLGKDINTFGSDITPFLASDNVTLYYSTEGLPGYGSSDIFMTRRLDSTWQHWTKPLNLGPEVNTTDWDAYYSVPASGDYAYLVSYENSLGESDIFSIRLTDAAKPQPVILVHGKVYNKKDSTVIGAKITYDDLHTGIEVGIASSDPNTGEYRIILPAGKGYGFMAEKDNFYSISSFLDVRMLKEYTEIERDLYLSPMEVGKTIRLNNIFFEFDKAELLPESSGELDRLVEIMKKYPSMEIVIEGHTDSDGGDEYNLNLSKARAKAVATYIIAKKINASRIISSGYGESKPIATNDTPEGRALNRRVEFTITKK
ncbi:MAG: OmpA family protein [Bacteroidetes bacterium]|nr:OmpA family protein [Bacteroidota bacterium]MBU1720222.1 OmpA family protein [Bacteroidota bacterium]